MSAILKFDFQKRKQLCFPEIIQSTQKRSNFACGNYIFRKTLEVKQEQAMDPFHSP